MRGADGRALPDLAFGRGEADTYKSLCSGGQYNLLRVEREGRSEIWMVDWDRWRDEQWTPEKLESYLMVGDGRGVVLRRFFMESEIERLRMFLRVDMGDGR